MLLGDAIDSCKEVEIFPNLDVVIQTEEVGHVADHPSYLHRVAKNVDAVQCGRARRWLQQCGEHADRRGFSRAVRTDKSKHVSRMLRKRDAINGRKRAINFS